MNSFFRGTLLVFLFATLPAFAQTSSLSQSYREETQKVIDRLDELGIQEIACRPPGNSCLSPQDLSRELSNISYQELDTFTKDPGASRWSAFYATNQRIIYLNKSATHDPNLIGLLGVHELLGAIGRPEVEFYVTMRIMQLLTTTATDAETFQFLKQNIGLHFPENTNLDDKDDHLYLGGGVVVGGGGGDTTTLGLRIEVYQDLLDYFNLRYVTTFLIDTAIEVTKTRRPRIDYKLVNVMGVQSVKLITVPANLLHLKYSKKLIIPVAAKDIVNFLVQLHTKNVKTSVAP